MKGMLRTSVFLWAISIWADAPIASGDLIAYWDFNDSNLLVDQGIGTLTTNFPATDISFSAGTTKNALTGVLAGQSIVLRGQANNGVGVADFAIDTTGYSGLMFSLATQKTSTGFSDNQLSYSADGGMSFTSFSSPYNPPTAFDVLSFDLSGIAAVNDNPDAVFRIRFAGATSATGNNRIDNVLLEGALESVAVPEPSAWLLVCAAIGAFLRRWRGLAGLDPRKLWPIASAGCR